MFSFIKLSDYVIENRCLRTRVEALEAAIRDVVTQQGDNLCWLDAYQHLAGFVGVKFDPTLLAPEEMLRNCRVFVYSLHSGCPYRTGEFVGRYAVERLLHLSCGHCDKWWTVGDGDPEKNYFCPHCGHQQHFEAAPPV